MTDSHQYYITTGENIANSENSQMFGKPCFKINKKAFVCFFQEAMVFKLTDEDHREALSLEGAILFDPSGKKRPMKEWVQLPYTYKDKWLDFAKSAAKYVDNSN